MFIQLINNILFNSKMGGEGDTNNNLEKNQIFCLLFISAFKISQRGKFRDLPNIFYLSTI